MHEILDLISYLVKSNDAVRTWNRFHKLDTPVCNVQHRHVQALRPFHYCPQVRATRPLMKAIKCRYATAQCQHFQWMLQQVYPVQLPCKVRLSYFYKSAWWHDVTSSLVSQYSWCLFTHMEFPGWDGQETQESNLQGAYLAEVRSLMSLEGGPYMSSSNKANWGVRY